MKSKVVFLMLIALAAILMGCSANPETTLLEYQRTGGIAGIDDRLVIDSTGKAALTRKDQEFSFSLSADELKALQNELVAANFGQLADDYTPGQPGADLFDYRLTYDGHTVHMVDTAVPEAMQPILDMLYQLIEANS
jgi:hypothetical protein